jgi:pyrroline-5-carboxylate reductase
MGPAAAARRIGHRCSMGAHCSEVAAECVTDRHAVFAWPLPCRRMRPQRPKLPRMNPAPIAFIGGGNMASALIGGLVRSGRPPASILVVEPFEAQRAKLAQSFGIGALAAAGAALAAADTVVWAVKPQSFAEAAGPCAGHVAQALQLSVMAGIRSDAIVAASGSARVVRAMPNTPALIGQGIAGLYARPEVDAAGRARVEALFAPTGQSLWVAREDDLDAVTALSGSGPAYVFFFIEAMMQAGTEMGLQPEQARQLAQATFAGAAALAMASPLAPAELRAQVTSKGGTTHAAITSLQASGVQAAFVRALHAARDRAQELGRAG